MRMLLLNRRQTSAFLACWTFRSWSCSSRRAVSSRWTTASLYDHSMFSLRPFSTSDDDDDDDATPPSAGVLRSIETEATVKTLIQKRMNARNQGDFEIADKLRDELFELYNVGVHDYQRGADYHELGAQVDVEAVNYLIAKRAKLQRSRDYKAADKILGQLLEKYNVRIFDKDKMWRAGYQIQSKTRQMHTDFGPHGHDYTRGPDGDNMTDELDEEAVHRLIAARKQARWSGDFALADRLREELFQAHGVRLFDNPVKQWRAGFKRSAPPDSRFTMVANRVVRDFGPNGHDYQVEPDAVEEIEDENGKRKKIPKNTSPMTLEEIHSAIAKRLQCKLKRNFVEADQIQDGLNRLGIYLDDKNRLWRADGEPFRYFGQIEGSPIMYPYKQSSYSKPVTPNEMESIDEATETIKELLKMRQDARNKKQFHRSDELRDQLDEYNVFVHDRNREWSVGGYFGPEDKAPSFVPRQSGNATDPTKMLSEDQVKEIQALVNQREQARHVRDFEKADEVENHLNDMGVKIDNRAREWYLQPWNMDDMDEPSSGRQAKGGDRFGFGSRTRQYSTISRSFYPFTGNQRRSFVSMSATASESSSEGSDESPRRVRVQGRDVDPSKLPRLYVGNPDLTQRMSAAGGVHDTISRLLTAPQKKNSPPSPLETNSIIPLPVEQGHYLTSVLRLGKKTSNPYVRLFDQSGQEWLARISVPEAAGGRINKKSLSAICLERLRSAQEDSSAGVPSPARCFLVVAPSKKKDRIRWMIEKCTELNVAGFVLLDTEFSESPSVSLPKLQSYAIEAAEQSERLSVPAFLVVEDDDGGDLTKLDAFLEAWRSQPESVALAICQERSQTAAPILEYLAERVFSAAVAFLVGPEGGWSQAESDSFDALLSEHPDKVHRVSLGSTVLRSETACMLAIGSFNLAVEGDDTSSDGEAEAQN